MEISEIEVRLKLIFPERHREALLDPADQLYKQCDFLTVSQIPKVNDWLHSSEVWNTWPDFLIAFASQGCSDYFAYDLRSTPPTIIYVDPDKTVTENLYSEDKLTFKTFEEWYHDSLAIRSSPEYKRIIGEL